MPRGNRPRICARLAAVWLRAGCRESPQDPLVRLPIEEGADIAFVPVPFGDGASHATVTQITMDQYGFLWFGTDDGLKRFDGYHFRNFRPEAGDPYSISGLVVESLVED